MERPLDYSKCARPGCDENEGRIDNYCSVYCRDVDELNIEIAQLEDFVALVRRFINGEATLSALQEALGGK